MSDFIRSQLLEIIEWADPPRDTIVFLDQGDLKGKKIGNQWRVTRAAIDDYFL